MKKLLVILSAMLMIVAVSCSNDTPAAPSAGLDGTDITITVPTVDEDNVVPEGYGNIFGIISSNSDPSESSVSGFISAYGEDGEKVYSMEDGVYTVGVNGDVLKIGDKIESSSGPYITVNGRQYSTSTETGKAYQEDWDKIQETVVREVGSNEKGRTYRRVSLTVPVLDENGLPTVDETGAPVTKNVTCTIDVSERTSTTVEYYANGNQKTTIVTESTYDLSKALSGITSMTVYDTTVRFSSGSSLATAVLEVTRDGETSTYAM